MVNRKSHLIREFSEFNAQRLNSDSVQAAIHVDNPQLSTNAFDKHQDQVRQAISRIGDISNSLYGSNSYKSLRSKFNLEDQEVKSLKIIRIMKSEGMNYDVYITYKIGEDEYWGVVKSILTNPDFRSEIFKDGNVIQTKEWVIRLNGFIVKAIKRWLMPQYGKYRLIGDDITCYSSETGKILVLPKGSEIEVLKSYENQIIFKFTEGVYSLKGENFVFFNWRFEEIK